MWSILGKTVRKRELVRPVALGLILALAAFLRLWQSDMAGFKMDESGWLTLAGDLLDHGKIPQIGSVDPNTGNSIGTRIPPLMAYLMAIPLLFSRDPAVATAFVGLMNVLAVALVYWISARHFGKLDGLLAALFYAASTTATLYSRNIWSNYMLAPFVVLFIAATISLFVERRHWHLVSALFLVSWIIQLHPSTLPLMAILLLSSIVFYRELRWRPAICGIVVALSIWLPYFVWIWQNRPGDLAAFLSFISSGTATTDLSALRSAIAMVTTGDTEIGVSFAAPAWIPGFGGYFWYDYLNGFLLVFGFIVVLRKVFSAGDVSRRKKSLIVLLWVILPILLATRHAITLNRFYMLPLTPALFILMGIGTAAIVRRLHRRSFGGPVAITGTKWPRDRAAILSRTLIVLMAIALSSATVSQAYMFVGFLRWADSDNPIKAFGYPPIRYELEAAKRIVRWLPQDNALILVTDDPDTAKVFSYLFAEEKPNFARSTLEDVLNLPVDSREQVYIVPGNRPEAIRQLEEILPMAEWDRVWSGGGKLQFALIGKAQEALVGVINGKNSRRTAIDFANGLRLVGYQIPDALTPGHRLTGLLFFQVVGKVSVEDVADYHLFNHIVDASDRQVAQKDSPGLPIRSWKLGEMRVFSFSIDLPADLPPGAYRWRLGAYDLKTMKRVEMRDSAGAISHSVDLGPLSLTK